MRKVLGKGKNRDRERGQISFRPNWSQNDTGALVLRFDAADAPAESLVKNMSPTAKAMYSAAQAGAGKIRQRDLIDAKYSYKGKADVSDRTKRRAWLDIVDAGLATEDNGIVRLLDPKDAADTPGHETDTGN